MTKRIISSALLVSMLASLVACGGEGSGADTTASSDETTTEAVETTDPAKVLDLETKDWGGEEFMVLGRDTYYTQFNTFEVYAEAENGDVVNDAIFRRNTLIEDTYNVKIAQTLVEDTTAEMQKQTLAGEDLYDLVFLQLNMLGSSAWDGYLYNLYDVPNIDFSKDWWNPVVNESVELGGKLFFTSSDFSLRDKNRAYILIHNTDMATDFSLTPVIDHVRAGTWTLDVMSEYVKTVAADLDGQGMLPEVDRWGLTMDSIHGFSFLAYGAGNSITKLGDSGEIELAMNNERMLSTLEKLADFACDDMASFYCSRWQGKVDYDFNSTSSRTFYAGNALFTTVFPHSLKSYSANCTSNYMIVPPPKYDEAQEQYYSLADVYGMLFGIPTSCATPEFSGYMLEVLGHYSTDTTLPAYYEITCKNKYTYDADSAEMLDVIFDGIIYDIGYILNIGGMQSVLTGVCSSGNPNISSSYASKENAAKEKLAEILEKVAELG